MGTPLVHIFSADLQEGKGAGYTQYAREHVAYAQQVHADVLGFHVYLSPDRRRASMVQIHPDADSMDLWMKAVVSTHGVTAYEFLERGTERSLVYGRLNDATLEGIHEFGVDLDLHPEHLAGFTRLGAA